MFCITFADTGRVGFIGEPIVPTNKLMCKGDKCSTMTGGTKTLSKIYHDKDVPSFKTAGNSGLTS
jgi:hypothetical protein